MVQRVRLAVLVHPSDSAVNVGASPLSQEGQRRGIESLIVGGQISGELLARVPVVDVFLQSLLAPQEPIQLHLRVHQRPLDVLAASARGALAALRALQPQPRDQVHVPRIGLDGLVRDRCAVATRAFCSNWLSFSTSEAQPAIAGRAESPPGPGGHRGQATGRPTSPLQ